MSGKNQYPIVVYWQSTNPQTGFLPANIPGGSTPVTPLTPGGVMTGTNTIYSQIFEVGKIDNIGFDVAWSGTPVGVLSVLTSSGGTNWPTLTFSSPPQPAGSAGVLGISLNQLPFKYYMFQYVNTSGTGVLTISGQNKDLN